MKYLALLMLFATSASAQTINPITTGNTPGLVGTATTNHCVKFNDANGNITDAGAACGTGAGSVTSVATDATLTGGPITTTGTLGIATSAALPGSPTTTTQTAGDNSTKVATTAYVDNIMTTLGDLTYGGASGARTRLAGSTSASPAVLTQTGNGAISAAPAWTVATGTGSPVFSASPTLTGTLTAASVSATTLSTTTTGQSQIFGGLRVGKHNVADANYTITAADGAIMAYTSISAARTLTFGTNGNAAGPQILIIKDESGSASAGNTISLSGPTIDGVASPNVVVNSAFGVKRLYCTSSTVCFTF